MQITTSDMKKNNRQNRSCQVCGHDSKKSLYKNRLATIDTIDLGYTVVTCMQCGFVYANELATAETYSAYYRSLSKYDVAPSLAAIAQVDKDRAQLAVQFCKPYLTPDSAIVDLGCGSGCLLDAFKQAGWAALAGLDPAPAASDIARQLFGIDSVISGTLEQAASLLPLETFKLVCLTGVLEHLPDLRSDIARLVKNMSAEAMFFIEVPALERFTKSPCEPYGEFSLEHVQYFSCASLTAFFSSLGYAATSIQMVELPKGSTDSIYALFSRASSELPIENSVHPAHMHPDEMQTYIIQSETAFSKVLERIRSSSAQEIVIYGAGSHTARLLPRLEQAGLRNKIVSIVDNNPNLVGKHLDGFMIEPTEAIAMYPDATILISSFRFEDGIAKSLRSRHSNSLLLLYGEA
jgi:SAM-dependent methyltransferase